MVFSSSRRPVTSTPWLLTATKLSRRLKKFPRLKKLPLNSKVNGIVENPAVPTAVAPGGGVGPAAGAVGVRDRGRCGARRRG